MENDHSTLKIVPYTNDPRGNVSRKRARKSTNDKRLTATPSKIRNACMTCREKKTRCSGHKPCIRCQQHNQICQYMPTTSHRSDGTPSSNLTNDLTPAHVGSSYINPQSSMLGNSNTTDEPINSSRQETPEEPPQKDQYGHFHGSASGFAFLQFAKDRLARLPSMSLKFSDYPLAYSGKLPGVLPPKCVADDLIRHYFDFGIATSRFVHEPSLFASFKLLYSNIECQEPCQDDLALIYMVMATGSHYSITNTVFLGFSASVRFFDMAQAELEKESSKITFSSLQARLLVIHYLLNHSRMHDAWSSFGIVVRHAQALGLHRRSMAPCTNFIDHEYRKRLFWCIYCYDRILSSIFGRPCALHDDDIDQEECVLADDDDITVSSCRERGEESFCSAAALIHHSRLTRILGRVLREFYSPVRRRHSLRSLQSTAQELETSLKNWQDNLPVYLNYMTLPSSAMSIMIQRQMCMLKLTFAHTTLLLYRPFILYYIRATDRIPSHFQQWFQHCGEKSVESANMVVAECRYLFERGLFSRIFWLVNYAQFAAVGTLYMYSYLWPTAPGIRDVADEAMAEFPVGVEGDLVGQRYLEILKELQEVTANLNISGADSGPIEGVDITSMDDLSFFDDTLMNYGNPWGAALLDTTMIDEYFGGD